MHYFCSFLTPSNAFCPKIDYIYIITKEREFLLILRGERPPELPQLLLLLHHHYDHHHPDEEEVLHLFTMALWK
jgi:hypothetical protein